MRLFVVQLEYAHSRASTEESEQTWDVVARFDHDASAPGGHDVVEEGIHLDIYRDGVRVDRLRGFPRLQPGTAMRYCEAYLQQNSERLLSRFERWHDLDAPDG